MERYLKMFGVIIIVIACYLGVRYVGALIHYSCNEPEADGPPPICAAGHLGFYLTGGKLVPLWTRD